MATLKELKQDRREARKAISEVRENGTSISVDGLTYTTASLPQLKADLLDINNQIGVLTGANRFFQRIRT